VVGGGGGGGGVGGAGGGREEKIPTKRKKMISLIYFKNSRENQSAIPLIGLISAQILSMLEVHGFRKP
jgi:hypothetical protein